MLASGGTAKLLRDNNVNVTEVADYTKSPEIHGGRVKTLHPAIHGGLLARPTEEDHQQLIKLGWDYIDLVAVNLYPFEETIAKPNVTYAVAIENIDIGHKCGGTHMPEGKLLVKDRLADDMFQQVLLYPENYDVIAAPNLTGDYLADALAAQVGGIGVAPGANIGDRMAVFEPTHGTTPTIAGKNAANPTALLLSAVLMLEYMGWNDAAQVVTQGVEKTIGAGQVTADLAQEAHAIPGLSTTEFVHAVLRHI